MKIVLGVLLIFAAVAVLIALVVVPVLPGTAENTDIDNLLAQVLCKPGETVVREQYRTRDSDGTSYSADLYCINNENQRREATGSWILLSIVAFTVPLLAGIFMVIWGAGQAARRMRQKMVSAVLATPGVTVSQFGTTAGGSSPIEGLEINDGGIKFAGIEVRMDNLTPGRAQSFRQQMQSSAGGDNLAGKLRQLQEARDAGLITGDEYERLRKEVLDNLT